MARLSRAGELIAAMGISVRALDILPNPDSGQFVKEDGEVVPPRRGHPVARR